MAAADALAYLSDTDESSAEVMSYRLISSERGIDGWLSSTGGVCGDTNLPVPTKELSTQHFLLLGRV